MYRGNLRGRFILATLLTGILLGGLLYASVQPGVDPLDLRFGRGDGNGFQTQGPTDIVDEGLDIVMDLGDAYIEHLEAAQSLGPIDGEVKTPLVTINVTSDAGAPETTTIRIGNDEIVLAGVLEQVPPVDVEAILTNLTEGGWLPPLEDDLPIGGGDDPGNGDDDEDRPVFQIGDDNHTYAYLALHHDSGTAELILLSTPQFDGLRVLANPWFIETTDSEGNVIDLWVRNPFQAVALGDHVILQRINCIDGECVAKKQVRDVCRDLRPQCQGQGTLVIPTPDESGHVDGLPDTLLHVWAHDTLHGGAGISILDTHEAALAGPAWHGNPFTSEGLWVEHGGGLVATLHIDLPTSTHHGLGIRVGGPVVEGLTEAPVAHDVDLSEYAVSLDLGAGSLTSNELYDHFNAANAVIVGTWRDSDAHVQALRLSHLASGEAIAELVPSGDGDIELHAGPLDVRITEDDVHIEPAPDGVIGGLDSELGPASTAIARLRDLATNEVRGELRLLLAGAGCEDTARGCIGIVYDTVTTTLGDATGGLPGGVPGVPPIGAPGDGGAPEPPVDIEIEGDPIADADRFVSWVNARAGTVLGFVPAPSACTGATAETVDDCLAAAPQPLEALGAVVGLLPAPGDGIGAVPGLQNDGDGVTLVDGDGQHLIHADDGSLSVAGATASWSDDLITVRGPDGTTHCIRHTIDPDQAPAGTFPSLTLGCDGLAGDTYTLQPGAYHQVAPGGQPRTFSLHDPADPGSYLVHYHDDGTTTTISSSVAPVGTVRVPSTLVHITGDPVTSSTFGITLADNAVDDGAAFSELTISRQLYADGRALASTLPLGAEIDAVFAPIDVPESAIRVHDGQTLLTDAFAGNTWTSGLRDHVVTVTTDGRDTPARLELVHARNGPPAPGSPERVPLPLLGIDEKDGTHTYRGQIPANALSAARDGDTIHFALAWTEAIGPVATTRWDDNGGADYRYKLDMSGPVATTETPETSPSSVFTVAWNAAPGTGAPLESFHVETSTGATPGAGGWHGWIAARAADAPRQADHTGTPGTTHWFRTQACDTVGNCGPWSAAGSTKVLAAATPATPDPTLALTVTQPVDGAVLSGVAALAWQVDYDGDGAPLANIHHQPAGSSTWHAITSAQNGRAAWDTRPLPDGAYTLRFTATDGQADTEKTVPVVLANGNVDPTLDPLRESVQGQTDKVQGDPQSPPPQSGGNREKKGSPALAPIALVAALLGLLVVARPRRHG